MLYLTSPGFGKGRGESFWQCEEVCLWAGNLQSHFTHVYPSTDVGAQPTRKFKAAVGLALRWPTGLLEKQGLGEAGSDCFAPTCHSIMQGFCDACHFLPCNTCELWENCSREGRASGWVCLSDFEKENAHIKQELLQEKSYATSFTPLHLPCIHAGKVHTQRQQQHWILLICHSCCFLTTPSPSIIRCTGVLHQTDTEKWLISSALSLHSQPCHSCLSRSPLVSVGYYLIIASLACQFSLQPSDLPSHFMFFIFWITLFFWVCCRTAWSALSLSASVIPSINHSTTTFTAINLLPVFQIKPHFSLPYVNTSNKHRLNVFHF